MAVTKVTPDEISKIFWEEIGRTTLSSSSGLITVNNLPVRKYLKVLITATPTGGTVNNYLRLNNDGGNNYALRYLEDGAGGNVASQPYMLVAGGTSAIDVMIELTIINVASREKPVMITSSRLATGAATAPAANWTGFGKWANATNAITRIDITNQSGTGAFATGSEMVVLGHD